ncbi:MAG: hypothetical protein JJE03_04505 [Peptostreptococcaceae bacterium]|nr:hypothetical protein [Peptostreptococcaceae bacterium]
MYREDVIKVVEKYYKTIISDFSVINAKAMVKSKKFSFKKKNFSEDVENFKYLKGKLAKFSKVTVLIEKEKGNDILVEETMQLLDTNMAHIYDVIEDSIDYFDCMDRIRRKEEISFKDNRVKLQKLHSDMEEFRKVLGDLDLSYQKILPEEEQQNPEE